MNLETLKTQIPEFAKDARVNLTRVLTPEGAPDLTEAQIQAVALTTAYALKNDKLIQALSEGASDDVVEASKNAALSMSMSNIYYRFVHLVEDKDLMKLPVNLRMQSMQSPSVPQLDFEMMTLAVSVVNGCGLCMSSHKQKLVKEGGTLLAIQSVARIASVLHQVVQSFEL